MKKTRRGMIHAPGQSSHNKGGRASWVQLFYSFP
jgi:hypothetical protein